jgi:hypothetical protein
MEYGKPERKKVSYRGIREFKVSELNIGPHFPQFINSFQFLYS